MEADTNREIRRILLLSGKPLKNLNLLLHVTMERLLLQLESFFVAHDGIELIIRLGFLF